MKKLSDTSKCDRCGNAVDCHPAPEYLCGKRIQRSRKKGWRMPPNVCYVGRGSKWGNPFKLVGDRIFVDSDHKRRVRDIMRDGHNEWLPYYPDGGYTTEDVVKLFCDLLMDLNSHVVEEPIRERFRWMRDHIGDLKGKTLACWCKKENACHSDPLIELANSY